MDNNVVIVMGCVTEVWTIMLLLLWSVSQKYGQQCCYCYGVCHRSMDNNVVIVMGCVTEVWTIMLFSRSASEEYGLFSFFFCRLLLPLLLP